MKAQTLLTALLVVILSLLNVACADKKSYVMTDHTIPEVDKDKLEEAYVIEQITQGSVYFDLNQDLVKSEFYNLIQKKASLLRKNPSMHLQLEGNADIQGTDEHNYALAELRARAVQKYMLMLGVPAHQLSVVSYGSNSPLLLEQSEFANAKNRRVDFKVIKL